MKKVIAILAIAIILVGAVFADTVTGTLTVTTTIAPQAPTFQLYGNTTNTVNNRVAADTSIPYGANTLISEDGITLYCWIAQTNISRFQGSVAITVAASVMANTTAVGEYAAGTFSAPASISAISPLGTITSTRPNAATGDTRITAVNGTTATPTYGNGLKAAAGDIASFNVNWKAEDLPPASYSATVTMTYTAQ